MQAYILPSGFRIGQSQLNLQWIVAHSTNRRHRSKERVILSSGSCEPVFSWNVTLLLTSVFFRQTDRDITSPYSSAILRDVCNSTNVPSIYGILYGNLNCERTEASTGVYGSSFES
jgi:hypothetical protein